MKPLLILLTASTLATSASVLLLVNNSLERTKRDIDKITAPLIRNKRQNNKVYYF